MPEKISPNLFTLGFYQFLQHQAINGPVVDIHADAKVQTLKTALSVKGYLPFVDAPLEDLLGAAKKYRGPWQSEIRRYGKDAHAYLPLRHDPSNSPRIGADQTYFFDCFEPYRTN